MSEKNSIECEYDSQRAKNEKSNRKQKLKQKSSPQPQTINHDLLRAMSITLTSILDSNKNMENYSEILDKQSRIVFSSNIIPNISLLDYLIRIQTYTNAEKSTLIISLIYIDRICNKANITLTYYNIHRILFSAILLSIKYNEDSFYDNKYYAQIAGVKMKELKILEYNFAKMINCTFYVSKEDYEKYQIYLDNFKFDDNED